MQPAGGAPRLICTNGGRVDLLEMPPQLLVPREQVCLQQILVKRVRPRADTPGYRLVVSKKIS